MAVIYKRELRAFFTSALGYIFIAFILVISGIYTSLYVFTLKYPVFEYVVSSITFVFLICVPILTMRTISEEKRQKTDQLLFSLPLNIPEIVLGKLAALFTILFIPVLIISFVPLVMTIYGTVVLSVSYSSIIGFLFLGGALISIGMFISSLTENQIVTAIICFAALLILYLLPIFSNLMPRTAFASYIAFFAMLLLISLLIWLMTKNATISTFVLLVSEVALTAVFYLKPVLFEALFHKVLDALSLFNRFENFVNGIFDINSIVYFISVISFFVFLTIQSLEKRRWS